ncbi:unnamed protein product [Hermetia illucens]|uniref:Uncharacterized protein n=1 Tax=Hermetia illucens TaxID=343691 RepID=A0A7R8Z1G8_HERIL|nr:dynein light chain Tctex-type protein 2B-like [Hermetia illucens]CAD7091908.1 unnamed protein product [Hermetia illucens]
MSAVESASFGSTLGDATTGRTVSQDQESEPALLPPSTYQIRPSLSDTFRANRVKEIIQTVLTETLQDKTYDTAEAAELSKQIADQVSSLVRDLNMRRYKHVVQVTLGQQLGSGCRYIARCRWDAECDNQTSDVFTNASLFCICTVFGVYLY